MHTLSPSISREAYARLCSSLPPPVPDTPESRAARNDIAMMAVADLRPATAYEARLAVDVVAADAHAMDSFRLAAQHSDELAIVFRCRAQAASMMRQHRSIRLMPEREQMMRLAAEAPAPAVSRDAPPPAAPEPAPPRNAVFEAEIYAITHLDDAARIRANGRQGLPLMTGLDPAVPPPDPFFVETLVNGATPVLRELDAIAREPAEAA
ncbi:MAG TPA: hypothetical protein VNW90_02725 [Acetobacteraceae bacterium]|jgi:hypothetical protein|nr:hypothetical protein [Acetobacteraceae bacterium]